jgi:hypothetical protein
MCALAREEALPRNSSRRSLLGFHDGIDPQGNPFLVFRVIVGNDRELDFNMRSEQQGRWFGISNA